MGAGAGTLLQVLIEGTLDEGLETLWLAVIPERAPCSVSQDATASDVGGDFAAEMAFAREAAESWWGPQEKAVSPLEYWSSEEARGRRVDPPPKMCLRIVLSLRSRNGRLLHT